MSTRWQALAADLRGAHATRLWPRAATGVRDWQAAIETSAPPPLVLDAWPREPALGALLDPLAESPLPAAGASTVAKPPPLPSAPARQRVGPPAATVFQAARQGGAAPPAAAELPQPARPAVAGATAPPDLEIAGHGPRLVPSRPPVLSTPGAPPQPAASHPAATPNGPPSAGAAARVAALLARQVAGRPEPGTPGGRAAHTTGWPAKVVTLPLRRPTTMPPQAAPERVAGLLGHWSRAFAAPALPAGLATALLAARAGAMAPTPYAVPTLLRGAVMDLSAVVPTGAELHIPDAAQAPRLGAAALPPSRRPADPAAETGAAAERARIAPAATDAPSAGSRPVDRSPLPAVAPGALADLAATLARIESRLGVPAPAAPQWLDDDEHLAGRIHDILRRQAQRHGIDTP